MRGINCLTHDFYLIPNTVDREQIRMKSRLNIIDNYYLSIEVPLKVIKLTGLDVMIEG